MAIEMAPEQSLPKIDRRRFLRIFSLTVPAAIVLARQLSNPSEVFGEEIRDYDIRGTLDLGVKSGRKGPIPVVDGRHLVGIINNDSGAPQRTTVDITQVRRHWRDFEQDDEVWATVRSGLGPYPQAISVNRILGDGTDNQGASTGRRIISENRKNDRKR